MEAQKPATFHSLSENVGQFNLRDKTVLIPEMNRIGAHLIAGTFRSFGTNALVMETYKGLDLGKEFTSGKECFPCQVTTGDILLYLKEEKERLGDDFHPEDYVFFMPEAEGPCRFGMYNKYQRIVLDSFPELRKVKIGALTSENSYALDGMIETERARDFRKVAYFSVVIGDILDRLLWRIRPYEREEGATDDFIERSMMTMADDFESYGAKKNVIRMLERYGAEIVNASIAEWVDYTTYDRIREAKKSLRLNLKQFRLDEVKSGLKQLLNYGGDMLYQHMRLAQAYKRVKSLLDLATDHGVAHLDKTLTRHDLYAFELGTEACLSIAGIMEYMKEGYNGVVNVYPFTCMPSTITSSIMRPIMNRKKIPFLDAAYDGTYQPGREAAIRTFMYQAYQHFKRHGRKKHH